MADPWIKMRVTLKDHPKVVQMSSMLDDTMPRRVRRLLVIGALQVTWSLGDLYTEDGTLAGYKCEDLDDAVGLPGWTGVLASVGWLEVTEGVLTLCGFDEHNGISAKRRGQKDKQKRVARSKKKDPVVEVSSTNDDTSSSVLFCSSSSSQVEKKEPKPKPENWRQVLDRPAYDSLRADPVFGDAWHAWVENAAESGNPARVPSGRQAAVLLNRALEHGAAEFARAVDAAIAGSWKAPNPEWNEAKGGKAGGPKLSTFDQMMANRESA